jgi:protein disulfide-isomerase-like protein
MVGLNSFRCGHCKKLTPIYDEVATELKNQGSTVRLAKIDADEFSSVKGTYGVQGFPTLIFFNNGQSQKYSGQRSKEFMVNWLSKKTRDPVVAITASELEALSSNGKINIVYHGDISTENGQILANLAKVDDFNSTHPLIQPITALLILTRLKELSRYTDHSENPSPLQFHPLLPAGLSFTKDPLSILSTTGPLERSSAKEDQLPFSSTHHKPRKSLPKPSERLLKNGESKAERASSSLTSPYFIFELGRC